jgi:hypothetical protein
MMYYHHHNESSLGTAGHLSLLAQEVYLGYNVRRPGA